MNEEYSYPTSLKKLRACIQCGLIKTETQFINDGCENCKIQKNEIIQYITPHFKGMIAITYPSGSWCAKWLGKNELIPGFYSLDIMTGNDEGEDDNYENEYENIDDDDGNGQKIIDDEY